MDSSASLQPMTKTEIKQRLLKGINRRIVALTPEPYGKPLPYELHNMHWMRDLVTFRAFLLSQNNLEQLVTTLPE